MNVVNERPAIFDELAERCLQALREGTPVPATRLLMRLMDHKQVPSHSPLHHFIMPAVLLTVASMARGVEDEDDLLDMLEEAWDRAQQVPGGFCGYYGACGAGVGTGIFMSIFAGATPHSVDSWKWCNEITGRALQSIASVPGPCCCKRTSFLALRAAVPYIEEICGLSFPEDPEVVCGYYMDNEICKQQDCPFYQGGAL